MIKRIIFLSVLYCTVLNVFGQESKGWQVDFRTDVFSRHLWRGDRLGDAPAIEPEISLSKNKFSFTIWSASTFNNSYEELDLIIDYDILPNLNIALFDYYNPVQEAENRFWNYSGDNLRHTIEMTAEYSGEKIPVSVLAGVFLYGDKDIIAGKEQFSTYIESTYCFKLAGKDFRAFAGFTPFDGYYAKNFAFVNLGLSLSDSFPLGENLEIPIELTFCTNPNSNQTWFVAGIGIKKR